jgi:branched-chain amino acid transport system permease protein
MGQQSMTIFLPALGAGLVQGFALALVAVGFTVIYRSTRLLNFINGQQLLLGGYVTWKVDTATSVGFGVALVCGLVAGALGGLVIDRVVLGSVRRRGDLLIQTIALLAATEIADGLYQLVFGTNALNFPLYAPDTKIIPGLHLSETDLIIIGSTIAALLVLSAFLYLTNIGSKMRAVAENSTGAILVGIHPGRYVTAAWVIGGVLAALSGALLTPKYLLSPGVGATFTFDAFAAVAIGGLGSFTGAIVGGLVIAVAESIVAATFSGGYEAFVSLAVTVVVLAIKPTGLFGEREA